MNKPNKCKNCQWYGKPYWSIINPCDNCPNENDYKTIIQIDGEPVFKEAITEEQVKEVIEQIGYQEFYRYYEDKDVLIRLQTKEIERLNNIINELNNVYCKVITKCEEMIDSRFYMNDIAIKKYADEIKDICKYYVGEAKEFIIKENK